MTDIYMLREKVLNNLPDSDLTLASDEYINDLLAAFPGLPEEYIGLLQEIGYGSYGKMGFSIYGGPLEPNEIFDSDTANELENYIFVGDDYSGWMIGYEKVQNGYQFREFDHQRPLDLEPTNIVDFLCKELFRDDDP